MSTEKKYPQTLLALFSYAGVHETTHESVLHELFSAAQRNVKLHYSRISGDALIERSRSRALGNFLKSESDVMVMVDHDISWRPGDVIELARNAHERQALVGGLYCKRAIKQGWASRLKETVMAEFGADNDTVIEADGLATGFLAIPRPIVQDLVRQLDIDGDLMQQKLKEAGSDYRRIAHLMDMSIGYIKDGAYRTADYEYYDFFRCFRRQVRDLKQYEFLSEDWSFSERAAFCGYKAYVATRPILTHTGDFGYRIQDGMDDSDNKRAQELENGKNNNAPPVSG